MKNITTLLACSTLFINSLWAQKTISISNPLDDKRTEIISIPYSKFSQHFAVDSVFTIKEENSQKIYLHQLEKLGTAKFQNVLIQVPIEAKGKLSLIVEKKQAPSYPSKSYARYVPERFDDFAWENDVVAFRMYGKALEGRSDDAQGMDYWAKRTTDLVINKWYKEDDYHKDHGQGLDYYSVGQTLGAGDIALFYNGKVEYTKHYRQFDILDNGPLRTTFVLKFEEQDIASHKISLTKTISIDAAQQFTKIIIDLTNKNSLKTPVVFGLARRNEENPEVVFDAKNKTLAYWEPAIKDYGQTGTALIVPQSKVEFIQTNEKQFLLQSNIQNGKPTTYYTGAAWNKAGKITNAKQWEDYVEEYAERLQKPLIVKLK